MNTVAQPELTFQMLTVQTKIMKHKNFIRNYWNFEKFKSITKKLHHYITLPGYSPSFFNRIPCIVFNWDSSSGSEKEPFPRILSKKCAKLHLDYQIGVLAKESIVLDQWIDLSQGLFQGYVLVSGLHQSLLVFLQNCWDTAQQMQTQCDRNHHICYLF